MKTLLMSIAMAGAILLAACGGGGSSPPVPSISTVCNMPLKYANSYTSGIAIAPAASTFDYNFTDCGIQELQSVTLSLCIEHPALSELSGQLRLAGATFAAFNLASASPQGNSCLASAQPTTRLLQLSLDAPSGLDQSKLSGPWSLAIHDNLTNNQNGKLVGWSMTLQGLR